jgi:16S rRNA (guanine(966)-N(2))-methyltransferase RsmD
MRIISGEFGGRTILPPPSDKTRPITDRAKQSLFDALAVTVDLTNAHVLDCFAGTGSMGLESLSRGAAHCTFIERDRGALGALKQNLATLNLTGRATILPIDAYRAGDHPAFRTNPLRVAYIDPPYAHTETGRERHKVDNLLAQLLATCMEPDGVISFRHPVRVTIDPAALHAKITRTFTFGDMGITWLAKSLES